ncbi:MAG: rhodanese-like domain-containing protein [Gammaproteobacteria bacterium]
MEQLVEFATNHVGLVAVFFALLAGLAWHVVADPGGKDAVDPVQATDLINHQNAVVVDVRSMAEFNGGHIINAVNIPLNGFKNQLGQLEKYKDRPIVDCCRSGSRSGMAVRTLRKAGFEKAHNLRGGMLAWESANLPVKRRK